MAESESYEDADSNIYDNKKLTDIQKYQNFQGGGNFTKRRSSKGNESSSIYQDARSRVTNNSPDKIVNNISPYEKNEEQFKFDYLRQNKMNNDENNFRENENYYKKNNFYYDKNDNDNDNDDNNDDEGKSEYSEPEGGITPKNLTLFEGASQRGGCCNLPKCLIF